MATLFDSLKIGNLELKNRIIMAPMTRSRANDDGTQTDIVADYYAQRASAGLIITEATSVSARAKGYVRTPGIYTPEQIASWRKVADAVHAAGGQIFMQLYHPGRIALPEFIGGQLPVAPSAVAAKGQNYTDGGMRDFVTPVELTLVEIQAIVNEFAEAAKNALAAGFDGVELHAASGYLVHQFLSTNANLRTDEYGGSIEQRARFLGEVVDAMSAAVGSAKVGVKLSPKLSFNDIIEDDAEPLYAHVVEMLSRKDLAYLEVSDAGNQGWHSRLRPLYCGAYFANVGFTKETGANLLAQNGAEAIVYGALFIANPDLPARFAQNAALNAPNPATFYTPGEEGYTDYPTLAQTAAA